MQRSDRTPQSQSFPRFARRSTRAVLLGLALVALTATGAFAQTEGGPGGGAGRFGGFGGSGKLTGRSGSTLQIEGFTGTTSKVIVTTSTQYRQTEDTDASAITKGACIRVSGDGDPSASAGTSTSTSTAIAATRVSILDDAEQCKVRTTTGRRTFPNGGSRPEGGAFPEGGSLPNGGSLPTSGSRPRGAFGGGVTGTVTSVSGDTVVVSARVPKQTTSKGATSSAPKFVKKNVKVTLADSTTISHTVDATHSVLVVGTCVSSQGSTDSVGTVTAKTVTASQPDSTGACTGGFGGFPGGGPSTSSGSDSGSTSGSI